MTIGEFIQSLREFVSTAALRRRMSNYQIQRAKRRYAKKHHPSTEDGKNSKLIDNTSIR